MSSAINISTGGDETDLDKRCNPEQNCTSRGEFLEIQSNTATHVKITIQAQFVLVLLSFATSCLRGEFIPTVADDAFLKAFIGNYDKKRRDLTCQHVGQTLLVEYKVSEFAFV